MNGQKQGHRVIKLLAWVVVLGQILSLTSCAVPLLALFPAYEQPCSIERLFSALEAGDKEQVKSLFAPNAIAATEDFDRQLTDLMEFVQGELVSYDDWGGGMESASFEAEGTVRTKEVSYDVETTEDHYRFAIQEYTTDTIDPGNEGIYTIYVIRTEDDPHPEYAYWGNGGTIWEPGIFLDAIYIEPVEAVMSALDAGDKDALRGLFSPNALSADPDFEESATDLIDFVKGNYVSYEDRGGTRDWNIEGTQYFSIWMEYVVTTEGEYCFVIRKCTDDTENSDNLGIHSLYVTPAEDASDNGYEDGDYDWIPGINVNVRYDTKN